MLTMWIRTTFYSVFVLIIDAEIITLRKDNNLTCIAIGDWAFSAIYLSPPTNSGFVKKSIKLDTWLTDDWSVINSTDSNQTLVTDKRWEVCTNMTGALKTLENSGLCKTLDFLDFKMLNEDIGHALKNTPLSFSVCMSESMVIHVLAIDFSNEQYLNFTPNNINMSKNNGACQWFHYQLVKDNTTMHLRSQNKVVQTYELDFEPYWIYFKNASKNDTFWKLHDYDFKVATVATQSQDQMSTVAVNFTENLCLSFYVSVDEDCFLDVVLDTSDNKTVQTVLGTNQKNSFKDWQKIELLVERPTVANLSFFRGVTRQNITRGYWAVDEITFCHKNAEIYEVEITDKKRNEFVCEILNTSNEPPPNPFQNILSCDKPGFLGKNCNISCNTVLGAAYSYCENHTICQGSTCFCSWGYQGTFCNETCGDETWGLFCKNKCDDECERCHPSTGRCETSETVVFDDKYTEAPQLADLDTLMTEDDLPVDISMTLSQINVALPNFEKIEKLIYSIKVLCVSKWCDDEVIVEETVSVDTTNANKSIILNCDKFKPLTDYEAIVTANVANQIFKKTYKITQEENKSSQGVSNLSVYSRNSSTLWIRFSLSEPSRAKSLYKVWYYEENSEMPPKNTRAISQCELWGNFSCATIENLNGRTVYSITVESVENQKRKLSQTLRGSTAEKAPQAPEDLRITWSNESVAVLAWNHPFVTNGPLRKFEIEVEAIDIAEKITYDVSVLESEKTYEYLLPINVSTRYIISIRAFNEFEGEKGRLSATFFLVNPEFQATSNVVIEMCSLECQLLIPKPRHFVQGKYLIVGIPEEDVNDEIISSLQTKQNIAESNNLDWQTFEITDYDQNYLIGQPNNGEEKAFLYNEKSYSLYLVLQSLENSNYTVYLIATSQKNFEEKEYTPTLLGSMTYLTFTIILISVVLSAILLWLLYLFGLKRGKKSMFYQNVPLAEQTLSSSNSAENTTKVEIRSFENYLKHALVNVNDLIDQFRSLPEKTRPTVHAVQNKNKNKNKNQHYVPYDHNRVVLKNMKGMGSDDYINASYIDGFDCRKTYIATQGPKFCTLRDFWRMIWQERVETIVMATNFMETKQRKCAEYFPQRPDAVFECGEVFIKLIDEDFYESYIQRNFEVRYGKCTRKVQHFQMRWSPDDRIPLYPNWVLPLVKKISTIRRKKSPVVVHCSSGSNRTGTLILCDMALQMAKTTASVDFYSIIKNLRDQRPNMISSEKQYILAHLVFSEWLMEQENIFKKSFKENLSTTVHKNQLDHMTSVCKHDEIVRSWTPYQTVQKSGLFLPVDGYLTPRKFFTTQFPTKNTLGTFWSTVIQEKMHVIVVLNPNKELWPYRSQNAQTVMVVKKRTSLATTYCTYSELLLAVIDFPTNKIIFEKILHVLQANDSSSSLKAKNAHEFLNILDDINKKHYTYPFLIVCNDGVTTSGLFVTLDYIIEKCKSEVEIDVCGGIRTVRRSGLPFISNPAQMEFLYKAILEYLQKFDQYSCIL